MQLQETYWGRISPTSSPVEPVLKPSTGNVEYLKIPSDGTDDWEIDYSQLKLNRKVASGSFGDL